MTAVADLYEVLATRRSADAVALVLEQLDVGTPPARIVTDLLAPVMVEVGRGWQRAELSVADEHAASAAVDQALAALAAAAPADRPHRGFLAVVSAEGEWHTLPARMAAELLRWDGWEVALLAGSVPATDLAAWFAAARPDGVVISCALPAHLLGAARVAQVAEQAGVPVVLGGWGVTADRAAALGLRATSDVADLTEAFADPVPHPADLAARRSAARAVEVLVDDLAAALVSRLDDAPAATVADTYLLLDTLTVAVLTGDPQVYVEHVAWWQGVLTARGTDPRVLPDALRAVVELLPDEQVVAGSAAEDGHLLLQDPALVPVR